MHHLSSGYLKKIKPYLTSLSNAEYEKFITDLDDAIVYLEKHLGKNPKMTRWIVQSIGHYIYSNSKENFYVDYQKISLTDDITYWCFQAPAGGCVHLFQTPQGKLLIDCGYGANYDDWCRILLEFNLGDFSDTRRLLITHGDADHCGMSGLIPCAAYMHPVTKKLLEDGSRGFAAVNDYPELVRTYTTGINVISKLSLPKKIQTSPTEKIGTRGEFPVIDTIDFCGLHFEVWESKGGHLAGQLFYYEPNFGLLFTSDCFLNPASITKPRKEFGSIPDYLITSVNINSRLAAEERKSLLQTAHLLDSKLKAEGKRLRLCCGHGAVSGFDEEGKVRIADSVTHFSYRPKGIEGLIHAGMKLSRIVKEKTA
ncbi:MAG TPA: hypothetical protein O0W95_01455 [Methanocorpusculum sp.]|nr:hypothetical protein [Lachnospiraceae bacterium]MDO5828563.1 hypothetical protein [Methanocorpusculum sp.]HJJ26746.1 hypothetical protein [Methanocorpusculum sp.]